MMSKNTNGQDYYADLGTEEPILHSTLDVKNAVESVLGAYKGMQVNLESESAREFIVNRVCETLTKKRKDKDKWKY